MDGDSLSFSSHEEDDDSLQDPHVNGDQFLEGIGTEQGPNDSDPTRSLNRTNDEQQIHGTNVYSDAVSHADEDEILMHEVEASGLFRRDLGSDATDQEDFLNTVESQFLDDSLHPENTSADLHAPSVFQRIASWLDHLDTNDPTDKEEGEEMRASLIEKDVIGEESMAQALAWLLGFSPPHSTDVGPVPTTAGSMVHKAADSDAVLPNNDSVPKDTEASIGEMIDGSTVVPGNDGAEQAVDWAATLLQCAYRCHLAMRKSAKQQDRRAKIEPVTSSQLARYALGWAYFGWVHMLGAHVGCICWGDVGLGGFTCMPYVFFLLASANWRLKRRMSVFMHCCMCVCVRAYAHASDRTRKRAFCKCLCACQLV